MYAVRPFPLSNEIEKGEEKPKTFLFLSLVRMRRKKVPFENSKVWQIVFPSFAGSLVKMGKRKGGGSWDPPLLSYPKKASCSLSYAFGKRKRTIKSAV